MSFKVFLSGHLKSFSNGQTEVSVPGNFKTVDDVLSELWRHHISLRDRIITEQGQIRPHVNIYYQGEDIRRLKGLLTHVEPSSELHIFNAVSGG